LSKIGQLGRENPVAVSKTGGSWGRKGSATRIVGKAHRGAGQSARVRKK
jgi:hypothetical protein